MVYELEDTSKVKELFADWQETLIYSCLQNVMGKIYVTDTEKPESTFAFVGCFGFFAGRPDRELVSHKPDGFVILVPQNEAWSAFDSKEQYLNIGRGMVILKDGEIVSGASSYTRYNEGIEIEVRSSLGIFDR